MANFDQFYNKTVEKFLKNGIELNEAKLELSLLIKEVFGLRKKDLLINSSIDLPEDKLDKLDSLVKKRLEAKIPVQYLISKANFMGEEFYVNQKVLIPRPETELLVEEVCKLVKEGSKIIDIGTGSGCIAIILAKKLSNVEIFALDISSNALEVAKFNAEKLEVKNRINFIHSDMFESVDLLEKFDVIVSNPPYISIKEKEFLQVEVARHEPSSALFVEDDAGVSFYEKLAQQAIERLNFSGYLAVEIGFSQEQAVSEIFTKNGFKSIQIKKDLSGINRVVIGKLY